MIGMYPLHAPLSLCNICNMIVLSCFLKNPSLNFMSPVNVLSRKPSTEPVYGMFDPLWSRAVRTDHYCSLIIGLFLPTLNKVSESVPDVYTCICCRLHSKDSKDRLFLHMGYLIQCILKKVWLLYCSVEVGGRVWKIHTDICSVQMLRVQVLPAPNCFHHTVWFPSHYILSAVSHRTLPRHSSIFTK